MRSCPRPSVSWLAAFFAVTAACSSDRDNFQFRVETSSLGDSSTPHEPVAAIEFTLNLEVDPGSVTGGSVFVVNASGTIVQAIVELASGDAKRVRLRAVSPFASGGVFRLNVTRDLRSVGGEVLAQRFEREFTTADRREFGSTIQVAAGLGQVRQVAVDGLDHVRLLVGEATPNGSTRVFVADENGAFDAVFEEVTSAPFALGVGDVVSGPVSGGIVGGTPGALVERDLNGVWLPPIDIAVQVAPSDLPAKALWPDPFNYRFRAGGPTQSGIRIGPLVASQRSVADPSVFLPPVCKVWFPIGSFDVAFAAGEEVWDAVVSPTLAAPIVLGARTAAPRSVWVWSPGDAGRTELGPLSQGEWLDSGIASGPFGRVVAAWVLDRSDDFESAPFETEVSVALFDPVAGWTPSIPLQTRVQNVAPLPESAVSPAANGDAVVAWSLAEPGPNKTLRVACHRPRRGWVVQPPFSSLLPREANAFDVAIDANGHIIVAWADLSLGERTLSVRRYDAIADLWLGTEVLFTSQFEDVSDVHLVADSQGRFTLVWSQDGTTVARRFQ